MSDMPTKCLHGRNFCLECHGDHRPDDPAPKPRCPVFGCTIPRSIPHSHPAGAYMVMRDPVAPMSRVEREHLKALSEAAQNGAGFTLDGKFVPGSDVYVVPADAPMVPGRKLRDALLMAGHNVEHFDKAKKATEEAIGFRRGPDFYDVNIIKPKERRSFVKLISSIAWRLAVALVVVGFAVLVLAGSRP